MENAEFNGILLKRKKETFIKAAVLSCEYCKLTVPKINFYGCRLEGANGPELAHYHPDEKKICISERQLKIQNEYGIEETAIHEVMHHLGLMHESSEERIKFEQIKTYVRTRIWHPSEGSIYVIDSGKESNDANKPPRPGSGKSISRGRVKEDLNSEIRVLIHQLEEARDKEERIKLINEIDNLMNKSGNKVKIKDKDREALEKLRPEDKEVVDRILTGNPFSDEEWEEIINKVYAGKEDQYGFGEEYGETRWSMKKKGLWDKIRDRLSIKK